MKFKKTILHKNINGLDHKKVNKSIEGGLTYLCDMILEGHSHPLTIYKVKTPNREKDHKDYVGLYVRDKLGYITGFNSLKPEQQFITGVHCTLCDTVAYSAYRHDMSYCKCGAFYIDGGRDYNRTNSANTVIVDLLSNKVVKKCPKK
jgi:hypothetical protein